MLWLLTKKARRILLKKFKFVQEHIKFSQRVRFPAEDIIFGPNIFAVATGIIEHNNYAKDFFEAKLIKAELLGAKFQGVYQMYLLVLEEITVLERPCTRVFYIMQLMLD